jgi:hypothetical protein
MGVVAKMAAYAAATYSLVLEGRALVKSAPQYHLRLNTICSGHKGRNVEQYR